MKKKLCAAALSLALSCQFFSTSTALASSVDDAVQKIKQQPSYNQLVNDLTSTGKASEQDVNDFVTNVVNNLDGEQITEGNIKSKVKEAASDAMASNPNIIDAVVSGLEEEDVDALRNDRLPASLRSMGDMFKEELIEDSSNTTVGGGGGAATTTEKEVTNVISKDYIETKKDGTKAQEFKIKSDAKEQVKDIKENDMDFAIINIEPDEAKTTIVNVNKEVVKSAEKLSLVISTPNAILQMPKELVNTLAQNDQDITVTMSPSDVNLITNQMNGVMAVTGATVLGTPLKVDTNYQGETQFTISLKIPTDEAERQHFLNKLAVFVIHNDGTKQIVKGNIERDKEDNPVALSFTADKMNSFAIIKQADFNNEIKLTIGTKQANISGSSYVLDAEPYIKAQANRTMVPIRFISEALGSEVTWKPQNQQVVINKDQTQIILTINSSKVQINGEEQLLNAPAEIVKSRTFIPLRFVSEALGATVNYNSTNQEIKIKQ